MTEQQIGELFRRYEKYLLTIILNRLYNGCPKDYAYDCLQDVFTIALEKKEDEKFNQNPTGWLTITAQNVVDNHNRKHTLRLRHYLTDLDIDISTIPTSDYWFEDIAYRLALENNLWTQIFDSLKQSEQTIFIMRYYHEMSLDDISSQLGMSKNALYARLCRIQKRIRKLIKKHVGET